MSVNKMADSPSVLRECYQVLQGTLPQDTHRAQLPSGPAASPTSDKVDIVEYIQRDNCPL